MLTRGTLPGWVTGYIFLWWGLDPSFWGLVDGHGTSLNFPVARLYTITGMNSAVDLVTGVWVLTVATVGVGVVEVGMEDVGWMSTLTLYLLLVIMALFLLSLALGPGAFLIMGWCLVGLVTAWFIVDRFALAGFVAAWFGVGAWALDQASS